MSLRPRELEQVVTELDRGLSGAVVQKVASPSPNRIVLTVRQPGRTTLLMLATESGAARVSVVEARPAPSDPEAESRQRFFRQELVGAKLVSLARTAARVVTVSFTRGDEPVRQLVADLGASARIRLERAPGPVGSPAAPATASTQEGESRLAPTADLFPYAVAAEALFREGERGADAAALRRRLARPLETRLRRLDRTLAKVAEEANRGPRAEEHRRLGELLRHHQAALPRGAREAILIEYAAEGPREVRVPLDPARSPKEQVEHHFHQYRRLLRGADRARERHAQLLEERSTLAAQLARLQEALLPALQDALSERPPSRASASNAPTERLPYREHRSERGDRIWVGRGGVDNDALTFKVARPEHWWIHARGVPGAHVVVPLGRDAELSPELLLDAAHLAFHHSDLKGEAQGEVSYTRVKFVRKVKGGAPGQVTYTRERTFWLRVEPARLARLLADG